MPSESLSQQRLMRAAAHTPGGYDGVPKSVGRDFVNADKGMPAPKVERVDAWADAKRPEGTPADRKSDARLGVKDDPPHPRTHALSMASATHLHKAGYISGAKKDQIHAAAGQKLAMAKKPAPIPYGTWAPK